MRSVYLDYNATMPVRPEVRAALAKALDPCYGNPSSIHQYGHRAKILLESARESVAEFLNARPDEILFTGGGTEANNLAIQGAARLRKSGHLIVTRIEHSSVLEPAAALERDGFRITRVSPDRRGIIHPDSVLSAVTQDTFLISLMHSNNELGTVQAVEQVADGIRGLGILLHSDAVQSAGKTRLDVKRLGADLLSLSAHKLGGPPGVGCLWVRGGVTLAPLLRGGGQETNRRAGTEPVPLISGFGAAAKLAAAEMEDLVPRIRTLRDRLEVELEHRFGDVRFHGRGACRLANTISVAFPGWNGEELAIGLDLEGVAVSTGSACAAGTVRPSHVLEAIDCPREEARGTLRISLGGGTDETDLEAFLDALSRVLKRGRQKRETRRLFKGA